MLLVCGNDRFENKFVRYRNKYQVGLAPVEFAARIPKAPRSRCKKPERS